MLAHGLLDMIVVRREMKGTLAKILDFAQPGKRDRE